MRQLNRVPLSSLRAIEAIGRIGTLIGAADELGVTPGAVSQRLARAEAQLRLALFTREPAGMKPTDCCVRVLPHLTLGMEHLATAVAYMADIDRCTLTVSVAPIFASRWLIWRIGKFYDAEPSISVRIEPRVEVIDLRTSEVDICIRVGASPGRGVTAAKLLEQRVFPVCSPELARRVTTPEEILSLPVIRENEALFGWDIWLKAHGLSLSEQKPGPTYGDASLCLDAAMTGQGVFMAWESLACDMLKAGRLEAPLPKRCPTGQSYWLVTNPKSARKPAVEKFRQWLAAELNASAKEWRADES